jgi:hypothetical protein
MEWVAPQQEELQVEDLEAVVSSVVLGQAVQEQHVKVRGKARKVFPSSLDLDGDGEISVAEAWSAKNQILTLKRGFCTVLILLGFQQIAMFGTAYWAMHLAAEVHVRDSELRDDRGRPVSALQRKDRIDGLHYPNAPFLAGKLGGSARRLNVAEDMTENVSENATGDAGNGTVSDAAGIGTLTLLESSEVGFHGAMEISQDYFQSTWTGYMGGTSDWVVPFPDGTVRTVIIQGMGPVYAWGICGACPGGNVHWEATCPAQPTSEECSVVYFQHLGGRRLAEGAEEEEHEDDAPLLARASAKGPQEHHFEEEEGMERSLGGKHCA